MGFIENFIKKLHYIVFFVIIFVILIIAIITHKYYFFLIIILLSLLFIINNIRKDHNAFIVFMLFYGVFSRFLFYFTKFDNYNPIFLIPPLYIFIYIKEIIYYIKSSYSRNIHIFIFLYLLMGFVYSLFVNHNQAMIQMISYFLMFIPLFYFLSANNIKHIYKIMLICSPIILIYSLLQYFNIFIYFDRYWIELNHMNTFDSLKLGGNIRPFSVFTSIEEYGYYLLFLMLSPFVYKRFITITLSIVSFLLLFLFSIRMPIIIFIISLLYFLIKTKRWKIIFYISVIFIMLFLIINSIDIKQDIHSSEKGFHISLRHSIEPIKELFNSYSLKIRLNELNININEFFKKPFGRGLTHNARLLKHRHINFNIESALMQLILSCGIIVFPFLIIVLYYSGKILIYNSSKNNILILSSLLIIILAHAFSFHFITPLIYKILIEGNNE